MMVVSADCDASGRASQLLAASPVTELRRLRVSQRADRLEISGRVESFYHKQLAQETVRPVVGGLRLVNEIAVDA
jgi:hypothetical protein